MNNKKYAQIIEKCMKGNPCEVDVRYDEPMKDYTTFKVGGNADCWVCPDGEGFTQFCIDLLSNARSENIPVFVLGGGANIVVSDKGIRGIALDMREWNGESVWGLMAAEDEFVVRSGTPIDIAADMAASACLSGVEFFAGLPGSIGGALWMNARCYGKEISDVLSWVEVICNEQLAISNEQLGISNEQLAISNEQLGISNEQFVIRRFDIKRGLEFDSQNLGFHISEFGYKKSPFQKMDCIIISACFKLKKGDKEQILVEMENYRFDRQDKGHYLFPCAGSAFKNNTDFGKPTGKIIDELGLKGLQIGGAQVAPFHGNIIINTGNATAADIRDLMDKVAKRVKDATGFVLEPEVLFVGEW